MPPPEELVNLSRRLGLPERELAILAEGNTSSTAGDTFWVKASGHQLHNIEASGFVECDPSPLIDALDKDLSDPEVHEVLLSCRVGAGSKPSVEAFMHAWLLSIPRIQWVGHVHPTAALAILCHEGGRSLCTKRFFPDEVVCCGVATAWVPYVDPGLALARAVRDSVTAFVSDHGTPPSIIWMANHGTIGLGRTSEEVESALLMNDKVCRFVNQAGGPRATLSTLSSESVERIRNRPDEHYRQELLWKIGGGR